jgi:hypothetical protein
MVTLQNVAAGIAQGPSEEWDVGGDGSRLQQGGTDTVVGSGFTAPPQKAAMSDVKAIKSRMSNVRLTECG